MKTSGKLLTAQQRRDLVEALGTFQEMRKGLRTAAAVPPTLIDKMPGFSPMQLRQQIDKIAQIHRELEILTSQFESALTKIKGLEAEEAEGLDKLKTAASEMRATGKFVAEAEQALLEFTAYSQEKRPGIEQMIARLDDTKWGEKAGDLFGRIAAKLGADIAKDVEEMYKQCSEDLTHTAMAVKGLKVISKTAGIQPAVIKAAGLVDAIVSLKEWLAGKADAVAQRLLGFAGDISKWLKGFIVRREKVEAASNNLQDAIKAAMKETDKLLAGA